jgi:hypothetical protein
MRSTRLKAGSIDHIGSVIEKWLEEKRILGRVVLEIGVLHDDKIGGCMREATSQCSPFAMVTFVSQDLDTRIRNCCQNRPRTVRRSIIDNDDFLNNWRSKNLFDERKHGPLFVVTRDDDTQTPVDLLGSHRKNLLAEKLRVGVDRAGSRFNFPGWAAVDEVQSSEPK